MHNYGKRHSGLKYIFVLHLAPQFLQSSWALPEVSLADKGVGRPKTLGTRLPSNLLVSFSQFSRDLTIYVKWKHDDFLKNLLGTWQYIKMKIRWEVLIDFMDSPHESIDRRPISHDFHISPRSSLPGINQTNDNQEIHSISPTFPLLCLLTRAVDVQCVWKSCIWITEWKVDAIVVVSSPVIARVNLRNV